MVMLFAVATPALAVNTAQTYNSGLLVLAFVGICAVVVLVQLMPSLLLLYGWLKALGKPKEDQRSAEVRVK